MIGKGFTGADAEQARQDVHVGGEGIECLIEVVRLDDDAAGDENGKNVGRGSGELVVAGEGELDGDAEAFDGHDRYRADERADGDVDDGDRAAVAGHHSVYHDEAEDKDDEAVH